MERTQTFSVFISKTMYKILVLLTVEVTDSDTSDENKC